jgi:hypothetical protein
MARSTAALTLTMVAEAGRLMKLTGGSAESTLYCDRTVPVCSTSPPDMRRRMPLAASNDDNRTTTSP